MRVYGPKALATVLNGSHALHVHTTLNGELNDNDEKTKPVSYSYSASM